MKKAVRPTKTDDVWSLWSGQYENDGIKDNIETYFAISFP